MVKMRVFGYIKRRFISVRKKFNFLAFYASFSTLWSFGPQISSSGVTKGKSADENDGLCKLYELRNREYRNEFIYL